MKHVLIALASGLVAFVIMCALALGIFTAFNEARPPEDRIDLWAADPTPADP